MVVVPMLMCAIILIKVSAGMANTLDINLATYHRYSIKPSGCQNTSSKQWIIQCATKSLSNYQPFKYVNGECKMCPGNQVTNLTFDSEQFFFPMSQSWYLHRAYGNDPTTAAIMPLSRPVTPGTMIYLAVTPLGTDTLFDLRNRNTRPFHISVRFSSGRIGMNTLYETNTWGTEVGIPSKTPSLKDRERTFISCLPPTEW